MSDAVTFEAAPALDPRSLAEAARAAILARFPSRSSVCSPMFAPSRSETWGNDMDKAWGTSPTSLHRLQLWLRRQHPQNTAKEVARDIGADPRTVENWLASEPSPPIWRHFEAMVQAYGPAFVAFVLAPDSVWQRREELRRDLDALEHRIRAVREAHGW